MSADVEYLLTAEEAWPAFETEVLSATRRVVAGFRVFDPMTQLRSDEGCEIGDDWFDLLVHVLRKGVRFDLILSDFDPIIAPDMHELTWSSLRKLAAIREAAGDAAELNVIPAMHPGETGRTAEIALWPKVWQELGNLRDWLNEQEPEARKTSYGDLPGTHQWLTLDEDGKAATGSPSPPPLHPVSHHQKVAVVDDRVLYVGGLDLNPRRYDTKRHHRAAEETWHDVQMIVRDQSAAEAARQHLDTMIEVTRGETEPAPEHAAFSLTLSRHKSNIIGMAPDIVRRSISDHHMAEIASAERSLYFETQFFRDRDLATALVERAAEAPDLELLMVLPAAPEDIAFEKRKKLDTRFGEYLQAECVDRVIEAFGDRAFFACPAQKRSAEFDIDDKDDRASFCGAPLIYVHAKVSVFDRRAAMVSSANLNSRSLHWDTEAGYLHRDPAFAERVLSRSMAHWLPDCDIDPSKPLVPQVRAQAELDYVRQPENRTGFLLPYDVDKARDFGMNLPGVSEELV